MFRNRKIITALSMLMCSVLACTTTQPTATPTSTLGTVPVQNISPTEKVTTTIAPTATTPFTATSIPTATFGPTFTQTKLPIVQPTLILVPTTAISPTQTKTLVAVAPTKTIAPVATSTAVPVVAPTQGLRGNCDPSYPTVCIPPFPPDLNCNNVPYKRFQVLPPDPHKFDADKDGIGCEN